MLLLPDTIQILLEMDGNPVAAIVELELKAHLEQGPVVLDGFGDGHFYPIPEALRRLVRGSQLRNRFLIGEKKNVKCCGSEVIFFESRSDFPGNFRTAPTYF